VPDHVGLAYDVWAPVDTVPGSDTLGKIKPDDRNPWFDKLEACEISKDYKAFYDLWADQLIRAGAETCLIRLTSRLVIGHGNPAPTEVGLTVQRTWGVPVIPGSALKGLLSHYMTAVYGPVTMDADDSERAKFAPPWWQDGKLLRGPGEYHRILFGAPDAPKDRAVPQEFPDEATCGAVIFYDALYVPTPPDRPDRPYARDVLTVHQKEYYQQHGAEWPNDYDNPNPVTFLTVKPDTRFLIAIGRRPGFDDWAGFAIERMREALTEWGIGAKTTGGYGRVRVLAGKKPTPIINSGGTSGGKDPKSSSSPTHCAGVISAVTPKKVTIRCDDGQDIEAPLSQAVFPMKQWKLLTMVKAACRVSVTFKDGKVAQVEPER